MRYELTFAGSGGQGILLMGQLLAKTSVEEGNMAAWIPSYGAAMRGGTANCTVVLSDKRITSPLVEKPDMLIAMNDMSLKKFETSVKEGGIIVVNSSIITTEVARKDVKVYKIDTQKIAEDIGNPRVANIVMFGAVVMLSKMVKPETAGNLVEHWFLDKYPNKKELSVVNLKAVNMGMEFAKSLEGK